jgi:hypothetical protein
MADTFKFDKKVLTDKIEAVKKAFLAVSGKKGYNPHIFLNQTVAPLAGRLLKGETTEDLHKAIMALGTTPAPITSVDAEPSADKIMGNPTTDKPTAPAAPVAATGLKIPDKS